jgi:MYXO-CTERM domain-containing protein
MLFLLRRSPRSRSSSTILAGALVAVGLAMTAPARAESCLMPSDCASGFCVTGLCCDTACDTPCHACRAIAKESGKMDGVCGIIRIGKACRGHCDGDAFSFVEGARCDQEGQCVDVPTESCTLDDPCKLDLCSDDGCEHIIKGEGASCGNGNVCDEGGACVVDPTTSSSSGSGGAGAGGGAGAAGGAGGGSTTTTGAGSGTGTETTSSSGAGGGYPPSHYAGCGCRIAEEDSAGGVAALGLAALALLRRRRA